MIRDTVEALPAADPLALDDLPRTLKAHDAELARVPGAPAADAALPTDSVNRSTLLYHHNVPHI